MTRLQLAKAVAKRTGYTQADTKIVVKAVFEELGCAMVRGDAVVIPKFGKFQALVREPRVCTNPVKPDEKITIPACRVLHLSSAPDLKEAMNEVPIEPFLQKKMTEEKKSYATNFKKRSTVVSE